jgi:CBS domain-containing protein
MTIRKGSLIMNIAFFITPKKDVIYEKITNTMRQALERMEYHTYTAIPILDDNGRYIGTLTEGDLLWKLKNSCDLDFKDTSRIKISDISLHYNIKPVHINTNIEDLVAAAINQNFVPVVDDNNIFIGIVKRSDIISYCFENLFKVSKQSA